MNSSSWESHEKIDCCLWWNSSIVYMSINLVSTIIRCFLVIYLPFYKDSYYIHILFNKSLAADIELVRFRITFTYNIKHEITILFLKIYLDSLIVKLQLRFWIISRFMIYVQSTLPSCTLNFSILDIDEYLMAILSRNVVF